MEFKGTKGEWTHRGGAVYCETVKNRAKKTQIHEDGEICQFWADAYNGEIIPQSEANANAKLTAAAPDLLNSLIDLVEAGENGDLNCLEDFEDARKAINKALK